MFDTTYSAYSYVNGDPMNGNDVLGLNNYLCAALVGRLQQGDQLTPGEREALDQKRAGNPDFNRKEYKAALKKLRQAEKYSGQRNKNKVRGGPNRRSSRFSLPNIPLPNFNFFNPPILNFVPGQNTSSTIVSAGVISGAIIVVGAIIIGAVAFA